MRAGLVSEGADIVPTRRTTLQSPAASRAERLSGHDEERTEVRRFDPDQSIEPATYVTRARWLEILGAPFIYAMVMPALLMDGCVTVFQWICFPIYGIQRVDRAQFFVFDRHKLHYLNRVQKFNCAFCSYFNSVISYTQEVASLTEERFCPIKHKLNPRRRHKRYRLFTEYDDAEGFRARLRVRRNETTKTEK